MDNLLMSILNINKDNIPDELLEAGIYCIYDNLGRNYIGKASCFYDRLKTHALAPERDSKILHRAINSGKYTFYYKIVKSVNKILNSDSDIKKFNDYLNRLEKDYIADYDSLFSNGKGYNMTTGGDGGNALVIAFRDITNIRHELFLNNQLSRKNQQSYKQIGSHYYTKDIDNPKPISEDVIRYINYNKGIYAKIIDLNDPYNNLYKIPIYDREQNIKRGHEDSVQNNQNSKPLKLINIESNNKKTLSKLALQKQYYHELADEVTAIGRIFTSKARAAGILLCIPDHNVAHKVKYYPKNKILNMQGFILEVLDNDTLSKDEWNAIREEEDSLLELLKENIKIETNNQPSSTIADATDELVNDYAPKE